MPQNGHSTVYRKTSASTAKSFDPARLKQEIADWAEGIKEADSDEVRRALLVKKQEAERALHPPRRSPEPAQEAEPDQIADSGLRRNYERSKAKEPRREAEARQAEHEPVKKASRTGSYAHGMSMAATVDKVCMRPDISWRGKAVAMALALHWPTVRPTNERLRLLTGFAKGTIAKGLDELNCLGLLTWKSGKSRVANEYVCQWLPRPQKSAARRSPRDPRTNSS